MAWSSSLSQLSQFSSSDLSHGDLPPFENLCISSDANGSTFYQRDVLFDQDASSGKEDEIEPSDHGDECGNDLLPSPIDIPSCSRRLCRKSSRLAMRDNLLAEAWERKRELALHDELLNPKEEAATHLFGRSSSDCGTSSARNQFFKRSSSDVGKRGCQTLIGLRTRNLRDDDFEELRGCIDLGFRFDETSVSAFGQTLPALEVYCTVAQNLLESPHCRSMASPARSCCSTPSSPSWRVASPGDTTEEVKERLRHWAQAVACNARICY